MSYRVLVSHMGSDNQYYGVHQTKEENQTSMNGKTDLENGFIEEIKEKKSSDAPKYEKKEFNTSGFGTEKQETKTDIPLQ